MTDTVLLNDADVVVVDDAITTTVDIADEGTVTITEESTTLISVGIQGPMGTTTIGGFGFSVSGPIPGDVLMFDGSAWANINKQTISDGGNF